MREHPDTAADEIAKHIGAIERGNFCSVVHVSANHRLVSLAVVVLEDGHGEPRHRTARRGIEAMQTFRDAPAEICAALCGGEMVYFLEAVLPHVADPQVTGYRVNREPPRISQTI